MGRLGNTPYELGSLELDVEGSPFAPSSLLNRVRREAVEKLQGEQGKLKHAPPRPANLEVPVRDAPVCAPQLHILVRTAAQLDAAIDARPASITLDYLDLYGLKPSLARIRAAGLKPRVASPRVLKPGEERIVDFLLSCGCPILVRSAGLLDRLRDRSHDDLIGDFSLNTANVHTALEYFGLGVAALTPTHDLMRRKWRIWRA